MPYRERPAAREALRPWLACVWAARSDDPEPIRILPDGCMDVVWTQGRLVVAGPDTRAALAPPAQGDVRVGVRLRPGAGAAALGVAAHELRDDRVAVADLWGPGGAELEERVALAGSIEARVGLLEDAVGARVAPLDPVVLEAARRVTAGARVADVAAAVALSERQLRRRFHDAVGYGPKTLGRVMRLQRLLRLSREAPGDGLAALAAAAGYADQAHLAGDCRRLTGLTPRELLAAR